MASSLGSFARSAKHDHIRGFIDGLPYQSAMTCGDGACALHAAFAIPETSDALAVANPRPDALALQFQPEAGDGVAAG